MSAARRRARLVRGAAVRMLRTVPDVRVAIALLFACTLAAPRAPLVHHHHAGGAHAHVHGDAALVELLAHGDQVHRHDAGTGTSGRAAFTRDTGAADGHVHHQQRYHAAVVTTLPVGGEVAPLAAPPPRAERCAPPRIATAPSARAPPRVPLA